ncbi:DUF305 domain-containing protein [Cellulomonas hominis]
MTGPDGGDGDAGHPVPLLRRLSPGTLALLAVLLAAAAAVGAVLGSAFVRQPALSAAADTSVDAGFARDMAVHHGQAVQLAVLVRDRSTDDEVRTVALDIVLTQQQQIGQMYAWLDTWGLPQGGSGAPMAWMTAAGHGHTTAGAQPDTSGHAAMPGWVSPADLARLTAAQGAEADRLFLTLMIAHHLGGVQMAQYAADHADQPQVVRLATGIVRAQTREVTALQDMLDARGGPVD